MKLVYTRENKIIVENVRNILVIEGIECVLRNEFSAGGMGELSPLETWPELWVQESDFVAAKALVDGLSEDSAKESWHCSSCGEQNEGTFELCWSCQIER